MHHFIAHGRWDAAPLEAAWLSEAARQVGGNDTWLMIDGTARPKKGTPSVGVAAQYAWALGKRSPCQTLLSVTLASDDVPVTVGWRLFLPAGWLCDTTRLDHAGVLDDVGDDKTTRAIAVADSGRVRAAGVRFGCVLADAGYGPMPDMV